MQDRSFTFFLEDGTGRPPAFEISFCVDDEAARDLALRILSERPKYSAVEVFDGAKSFRVERPSA